MPTQMSGLTSTPATGGTSARVGLRIGSVGHAAMFHGSSFKLYFGNHESTTRIRKSTVPTESAGPSAAFVGPTQPGAAASACARVARGQIGTGRRRAAAARRSGAQRGAAHRLRSRKERERTEQRRRRRRVRLDGNRRRSSDRGPL